MDKVGNNLKKYFSELYLGRSMGNFCITEVFLKSEKNEYYLHRLSLDVEDGEAVFYDKDEVIDWKDTSVLRGFLISSIVNIVSLDNNELYIEFEDGNIHIKVA